MGTSTADLLSLHHDPESGPQGHLGLPEAHVSANQPVHGLFTAQIGLHILNGLHLIRGFLILEGGLELFQEFIRRRKRMALDHRAGGVELNELLGQEAQGLLHPFLGLFPGSSPQLVDPGAILPPSHIFLQQVQAIDGEVQLVSPLVFKEEKVMLLLPQLEFP